MEQQSAPRIYIVFSGETEIGWLRLFLKDGFRHCYALINDGTRWITLDPLAHKMEIAVHHHAPAHFDLPAWLRRRGLKVVHVTQHDPQLRPLAPALFTCVEAVKRLIGLRRWDIMTPWQLYKALNS